MALILIVDDDHWLRAILRSMLEEAGHEVAEADDGTAGVEAFRARHPDVALVDIIMPGKCGISTIGEIRMQFPNARIIAISGGDPRGPHSDLPLATAYGAMRTLTKPVDGVALLRAIDSLLDGQRSRPLSP
jgi:two-component system chemotaxis response regulator CheY